MAKNFWEADKPADDGEFWKADRPADAPQADDGLVETGNIDLSRRPRVRNADGTTSTVRSMSANYDGHEVLIPTVSDDGRMLSDQEALQAYEKTGRHLGKFRTPAAATAAAQRLHEQQAAQLRDNDARVDQFLTASSGQATAADQLNAMPAPRRSSVLEGVTMPEQPFDPAEGERLSRRAAHEPAQPRRQLPGAEMRQGREIEQRSLPRAAADTVLGLGQGAVNMVKGVADNINAGDNAVSDVLGKSVQGLEAMKSDDLRSQLVRRDALIMTAQRNGGEIAAARAAFNSIAKFPGAAGDVAAQGAGSLIPVLGMAELGPLAMVATNALANAGGSASQTADALRALPPNEWRRDERYLTLIQDGSTHEQAVAALAPIYALPAQALGGLTGAVSGRTGVERVIAGRATGNALRSRAGSAGAELLGEQGETLLPQAAGNLAVGSVDGQTAVTEGLGRAAVDTAVGTLPGSALAAAGPRVDPARIQRLREAGDTAAADLLQRRLERENAETELARLPLPAAQTPAFQDTYRSLRAAGVKPAEAAARTAVVTDFRAAASAAGMSEKAIATALEHGQKKNLDDLPGFLHRFTQSLASRGAAQPVDLAPQLEAARDAGLDAAADSLYGDVRATMTAAQELETQQVSEAPVATAAPAFETGNDIAVTPEAEGVHEAATSPLNDLPEPSQAQKEAGNYKVGRMRIAGMDISVENPQGSVRRGTDADGKPWETPMRHHYGYIRGTDAADGDKLDVFVVPGTPEDFRGPVFVVDQIEPSTGALDEHKVILGARDEADAEAIYRSNYTADWQGLGAITRLPMAAFKAWATSGNKKEALGDIETPRQPAAQTDQAAAPAATPDEAPATGTGPDGRNDGAVQPDGAADAGAIAEQPAAVEAAPSPRSEAETQGLSDRQLTAMRNANGKFQAVDESGNIIPESPEFDTGPEADNWRRMRGAKRAEAATARKTTGKATSREKSDPEQGAAVRSSAATGQPITDFGEKIGGARKDVWSSFQDQLADVPDDEISAQPLSKVWPQPDYQAMLDGGADPWTVAFMRAARDEIPTKPRQSWKVKRWAAEVKLLRDVTSQLVGGSIDAGTARARLEEAAKAKRGLSDIAGRIDLYMAVGHRQSLAGVSLSSGVYSVHNGIAYNPPKVFWSVDKQAAATAFSNWPRVLADGETRDQAIENFKKRYDSIEVQPKASKEVQFDIYGKAGKYWIGKKIGRNPIMLAGPFDDVKAARAHKAENQSALVAKLEKIKEIPAERRDTNEPRVGEDMRGGRDVTPQMFAEAFGFRGVEFGNYVEQGKRQKDLNDAYDALMDMAAILDVPPRALSLNGQLGLAFGARGHGGKGAPAAHYERGYVVMNLTKRSGAGSLGHEWWHALDNYFARMRGEKGGYMTEAVDVQRAARGTPYDHQGSVRKEMIEAYGTVMRAIKNTALKARSRQLDDRRSKDYWTTDVEMSARAFESYLISKLQDQGASNDYLANIVSEATWTAAEKLGWELENSYPYPTAGEIPALREAFDKFFQTVETKETEQGVAMYARGGLPDLQAVDEDTEALVQQYGEPVGSILDAERRHAAGERIFAMHEQDDTLAEITSVRQLKAWAPDQLVALHRGVFEDEELARGGQDQTQTPAFRKLTELLGSASAARDMLSSGDKSVVDSLERNAKGISDFLKSHAVGSHGKGQVNIPSSVVSHVLKMADNKQIFGAIVRSIPVDVVDLLARKQLSPDSLLRDKSMLKNVLAVDGAANVSLAIDKSSALALLRSVARTATEIATNLTGGTLESGSATGAGQGDSVFGTHASKVTETASFSKWFGDSKVVDDQGKPLVVYHGAGDSISTFQDTKDRGAYYFTPSPDFAEGFAANAADDIDGGDGYNESRFGKMESAGANLLPVYLSVQNPFDPRKSEHVDALIDEAGLGRNQAAREIWRKRFSTGMYDDLEGYYDDMQALGFDGFYEKEGGDQEFWNIGVFRPEQIKSAIGNRGTFDPANANISMARGMSAEAFRRAFATPQAMDVNRARDLVTELTSKWTDGLSFTVVATAADLPLDAPGDARGWVNSDGRGYIVASNHVSRDALARTIGHEAIGHYGLWRILGPDGRRSFEKNMQLALASGNKELTRIREKVRNAYRDDDGNYTLSPEEEANEIAAFAVEEGIEPGTGEFKPGFGWFKQIWARIAAFLRDTLGLPVRFTNAELQGLLVQSMRGLQAGQRLDGGIDDMVVAAARQDQPVQVPDVIVGNPLGSATGHPDYAAAKAGDVQAAVKVARTLVNKGLVDQVRTAIGDSKPVIVPVVAEEATGRNKIPLASAEVMAKQLGLETDTGIVQANRPHRTGMDGLDRLFAVPDFTGDVQPGQDYLLLDDTLTQGATFATLASHIQQGGGRVVGAVALTGKQYSATIKPSDKTLEQLREKHGDIEQAFRAATGYGFDALTQSEARYLANYEPAQRLRDRVVEEGRRASEGRDPQAAGSLSRGGPDDRRNQDTDGSGHQGDAGQKLGRSVGGEPPAQGWPGATRIRRGTGPLTVYRGSAEKLRPEHFALNALGKASGNPSSGLGVWFTESQEEAGAYGQVESMQLDIRNPKLIRAEDLPGFDSTAEAHAWREKLRAQGHDGIVITARHLGKPDLHFVAFDPGQAVYPDADGALARGGPPAQQPAGNAWSLPADTRTDRVIYELQDGRVDLKRVQQAIEDAGRKITEQWDARLAETLYPGRVAHRSRQFLDTDVKPLLKSMATNKVGMDELSDYLHARGAEERNAQIAKVNPDLQDGGAGKNSKGVLMTNQAAKDYLAGISPIRLKVLEAMAKHVDAITAGTRKLLVAEGLEKQETIDAWEKAYKNYVPMFRDEAESGSPHPQGTGFAVKGSASKRATGSTKQVTNMLAHVLMQREAAITRAEKNRVALSLYGLALSHPNPEFWTTIKPGMSDAKIEAELTAMGVDPATAALGMERAPTIRTVDEATGKVIDRPNPMYRNLPGAIPLKVNGEDRVLMLNTGDERGLRLAESLKNLDGLTRLDLAGSIVGRATRWLAAVNTQYNPAFGLVNLTRDTLGGVINLGSTELRGNALKVLAQAPAAIGGIAWELMTKKESGKWGKLYRQFVADGGQTGYKDMWRDPHERARALEQEIKAEGRLTPGKAAHAILDVLDGFNTTLENAVRLSAYSAALDKGMSRAEAARLGRELTVDFNRKGRAGREVGPLYAFFNASVQGASRTIETLRGPTGAKVIAGGLGLGVLQALMLAAAGYDEDDIPEFVKARALIIPMPGDGKQYMSIPYPLGLHVIPNTGRVLAELVLNGGKNIGRRSVEAIGEIAAAFNPLGGGNVLTAHGALTTVAPTVIDPMIDLASNRNFAGGTIERQSFGGDSDNRPGAARARESTQRSTTGQVYIGISEAINSLTGGTKYEAGAVSPTPERVRYLAQTVGGGVLRELEKAINASTAKARGEKVKTSQIPVLGRFYGEVDADQVATSRYFENARNLRKVESSFKAMDKAGDVEAVEKFIKDHPEVLGAEMLSQLQREISELNRLAVTVIDSPKLITEIDAARTELMKTANAVIKDMEAMADKEQGREPSLGDKLRAKAAAN